MHVVIHGPAAGSVHDLPLQIIWPSHGPPHVIQSPLEVIGPVHGPVSHPPPIQVIGPPTMHHPTPDILGPNGPLFGPTNPIYLPDSPLIVGPFTHPGLMHPLPGWIPIW